jgi:hypothetical protein
VSPGEAYEDCRDEHGPPEDHDKGYQGEHESEESRQHKRMMAPPDEPAGGRLREPDLQSLLAAVNALTK